MTTPPAPAKDEAVIYEDYPGHLKDSVMAANPGAEIVEMPDSRTGMSFRRRHLREIPPTRPQDLPDLRRRLIDSWSEGGIGWGTYETIINDPDMLRSSRVIHPDGHREPLRKARLWWVSEDATDLIAQAAKSVPDDATLTEEDFGPPLLVMFESGILLSEFDDGGVDPMPVDAFELAWTISDDQSRMSLQITPYGRLDRMAADERVRGQMMTFNVLAWEFGQPTTAGFSARQIQFESSISDVEDRKVVAALLALAREQRIIEETTVGGDRASRRRAERAGRDPELDEVRVSNLRRSARDARSLAGEEGSSGRYRHRWIVSGHWTHQAYGPGRSKRRLQWIHPYMKGPEGAPLLTGDKVKVVRS